ncbi:MAG: ABC transporter permease [Oscillospiraceae bacterium]|nr:ABC transporter permease [Oscillospiraceae bacterium]
MKPSLSIKTLYRAPVKTILTFILLGTVTFALFSQTAEYVVIVRETNGAAKQYTGVGAAEITPPPDRMTGSPLYKRIQNGQFIEPARCEPLTLGRTKAIAELPYITSADVRYMTAGVSDTYYRPDDGEIFYNYTARCVIEGTLGGIEYGDPQMADRSIKFYSNLYLEDCEVVAGNPPPISDGEIITIRVDPLTYVEDEVGAGGVLERCAYIHNIAYTYGGEYIENLRIGARYAFVVRFEPLNIVQYGEVREQREYYLSDHLAELWCGAVWSLDGAPDDYLDAEEFAPLRELVEITNADAHTFDMVYTEDMSAIMRFADGRTALAEGRLLTPDDTKTGSRVCAVSREFAEENGLGVGDTLQFKLGTKLFEQYKGFGAVAAMQERYEPAKKDVTFEIVGVYADVDSPSMQSQDPYWGYSVSTVFVPKSFLPVDESELAEHKFTPAEFSFKVENAWDIPTFLEEAVPVFDEMGLRLIFHDDGWSEMASGFLAARTLSLIKVVVLSVATAAATGFVVYLFIARKNKEYAVMRALGTPRGASARALALPLLALTVIAVIAGGCAAWAYTAKTIAGSTALSVLDKFAVNTSVPAPVVVGCILGEILLALVIASVILRRIGARPPLTLLQDDKRGRTRSVRGKNI